MNAHHWLALVSTAALVACSVLAPAEPTATTAPLSTPTPPPATPPPVTQPPASPTHIPTAVPPESPSPAPTPTRAAPKTRNTAIFGASAGLVWNFIALDEGVMQFQVQADPNAFTEQPTPVTNDGEGIERVVFVVNTPDGSTITLEEMEPAYCLLGGNGPCNGFPLEGDTYIWPGGPAVQNGDYTVSITIHLSDGQTRDLFGNFSLDLP
ncbi:MAG: hypothetical protein ACT4QE_15820 [Anaerolineales bacterium]